MNESTLVGLAALLVTSLFAWLNKREGLRHDRELDSLRRDQVECKKESAECKEERAADRAKLVAATRALGERDERDRSALQAQIDELKKQVAPNK